MLSVLNIFYLVSEAIRYANVLVCITIIVLHVREGEYGGEGEYEEVQYYINDELHTMIAKTEQADGVTIVTEDDDEDDDVEL